MRILVPGRWQPLHIGHEQYIKSLYQYGDLVIGIGNHGPGPFSLAKRQEMIRLVFPELETVYLPENKFQLWQQIGKANMIATSNVELGLLLAKECATILLVPRISSMSATQIRERLSSGQSITGLVNPKIESLILEMWAIKES